MWPKKQKKLFKPTAHSFRIKTFLALHHKKKKIVSEQPHPIFALKTDFVTHEM